jgi:predicted AlkP superfamily phosphohydrolase/phosphomutase
MRADVLQPEKMYKAVRNVAPDLIVHFGGGSWRALDGVGYPTLHAHAGDTALDGCSYSQVGSFIVAAPNNPVYGEIEGVHMLDMAPTLLELGGYDIPSAMQGKSLVAGRTLEAGINPGMTMDDEEAMRERLRGLGYIA